MNKREQSIYNILLTSMRLFRENGFRETSVRTIAAEAGVSLGMINHYFGSKEHLGAQVLSVLGTYVDNALSARITFDEEPILYDLASVRSMFGFFFGRGYREFYLDSLKLDFFFNYLISYPTILLNALRNTYDFEASDDTILLYSKYLPYMTEKTVVLKKEEGLFEGISYDEIPYLICSTAMGHFIPEADIRAKNDESRRIAQEVVEVLEEYPPHELLVEFVTQMDTPK